MVTQTASSALLENVGNFQITKLFQGPYFITYYISDPKFMSSLLVVDSSLTADFWDMLVYRLDKVKASILGLAYNYGDIKFNQESLSK